MKSKVVLLAFLAMLTACAGTNFTWKSARQVQPGMSETEVTNLLGKPYMVRSMGDKVSYIWSYADLAFGNKTLAIDFKDGKVIKAPPIPESFND